MQILVADDSKTSLAIITTALKKLGHDVISASDGEQAIKLYQAKHPDLIILDVVMSGMGGFECARQIRAISAVEWIPIIFLSASVDDESIANGIDAGGDDYLTKPFSEITLAAKIKAMQRIADMRNKLFEATQKLFLLSSTDMLTGVYNRRQFDRSIKEILAGAKRHNHIVALMCIDLDKFKLVNDNFGHHIGDLLLVEVAKRIKSCLRVNDFIARLGGDEFAIILNEVENNEKAGYVAEKIVRALAVDYTLDEYTIHNGASIGIAIYPESATTEEQLIQNADVAMYHAKTFGRNNYQYFTPEIKAKHKKQINLESTFKSALEKNELELTYQPIYELRDKKIAGVAALPCWNHPQYGIISPDIYFPIAEELGLSLKLGNWLLESACEQYAKWQQKDRDNIKFSINIPKQIFIQDDFHDHIKHILDRTRLQASHLELEINENIMSDDTIDIIIKSIKKFHDMGISICINGFSNGYYTLKHLTHLQINTIKIEKSFMHELNENKKDSLLVTCLINLAKSLNLNLIIDGLTTKEQYEFLVANDCPQGQGSYLQEPLTAEEMTKLI